MKHLVFWLLFFMIVIFSNAQETKIGIFYHGGNGKYAYQTGELQAS